MCVDDKGLKLSPVTDVNFDLQIVLSIFDVANC